MLYIAVVPMATVGVKGLISVIYNSCIRLPSSVSQKKTYWRDVGKKLRSSGGGYELAASCGLSSGAISLQLLPI